MYLTKITDESAKRIYLPLLEACISEWIETDDFWTGSEVAYVNAPLGVDINVFDVNFDLELEEGEFKVALHENIMVDGELTSDYSNVLASFTIKPTKCSEHGIFTLMDYCSECEAKDDEYRNGLTCNECASDVDLCECDKKTKAKALWLELGDIPTDEDDCIEEEWHIFEVGTHREYIWHWFEEEFDLSVTEDLMFS